MREKILIIDNDDAAIQTITHLNGVLNLGTLVIHSWGKSSNLIEENNLMAVFVNIDLEVINLSDLLKRFPQTRKSGDEFIVPVYFLYSKIFSRKYKIIKELPHAGEVKKPIDIALIFNILKSLINLDERIEYDENTYRQKVKAFKNYLGKTEKFLKQLEAIME